MKKWMYVVIVCMSITLVGYSVMAYANGTVSSESKEVAGTFVALDGQSKIQIKTQTGTETIPLAKSVWVYKNQQKAGLADLKPEDQLVLILNTKKQAAYIKAGPLNEAGGSPGQSPAQTTAPSASPTASPTPTATPAPAVSETPQPSPTAAPTEAPQKQAGDDQQALWNKLLIQAEGDGLKLYVDQHAAGQGWSSKVDIDTDKQGVLHLKGQHADEFIRQMIAQVDLHGVTSKEQLIAAINKQLELNGMKLKLDLDVEWKPVSPKEVKQVEVKENEVKQEKVKEEKEDKEVKQKDVKQNEDFHNYKQQQFSEKRNGQYKEDDNHRNDWGHERHGNKREDD